MAQVVKTTGCENSGLTDGVAAAAAKILKDLHEQKQIEGRSAGA